MPCSLHLHFIAMWNALPFHFSILCKIGFTTSKFEIIDLFLNFKQTDFRTDLKVHQHLKLLIVKFLKYKEGVNINFWLVPRKLL